MAVVTEDVEALRSRRVGQYLSLLVSYDLKQITRAELNEKVRRFMNDLEHDLPAFRKQLLSDIRTLEAIYQRRVPERFND